MNKQFLNSKILPLALLLSLSLNLGACQREFGKSPDTKIENLSEENQKYIDDDTTEVLLDDSDINKDDIVKVIEHGDHWHVFTKDGKEHITYTDPNSMGGKMEMVSVVSLDQLKNLDVSEIKVHGNHWHVFTSDGEEYLTYENPKDMFPNIKIGKYEGHDKVLANKKTSKKFLPGPTKENNSDEVVKILKHGDHYHVYTASGEEFITYENPSKAYPNIKIGTYTGSHGSNGSKNNLKLTKVNNENNLNKGIEFISAVGLNDLKNLNVEKILKHEDHYHVYTKDGKELITYEDPSSLFPNIKIGTYIGSHGSNNSKSLNGFNNLDFNNSPLNQNNLLSNLGQNFNQRSNNPNEVVKILKHGDHYHVYTASGKEFITYEDPSSMYPNAQRGIYQGSHGPLNGLNNNNNFNNNWNNNNWNENLRPSYPNYPDFGNNNENSFFIRTINKSELQNISIKKIKKHGDHFHIYDYNNKEYITYEYLGEIGGVYNSVVIEEYQGSHGKNNNENTDNKWPKGITKIIDHGDHWHLYIGDREVGIVRENPKKHYPNAEYIVEKGEDHSNINVDKEEIFPIDDVSPRLVSSVIPYLGNLRAMTNYGNLNTTLPVFGSDGQTSNIFYWLHGNHYHAISVKQIIKNQKAGDYGDNSARDVVATLKYLIDNKKTGNQENEEEEDYKFSVSMEEVITYLKNYYGPDAKVENDFGLRILVTNNKNDMISFNQADFDKKGGLIIYKKGELPKFPETVEEADGKEINNNYKLDENIELEN
ncbi:hypothetical protein [uncultured Peptoniphilus sp.]|uniref:hypothetical protein n=1 Tax=uncultured Peptoniphilus sp. TaxID=254354 RepID=UPI002805AE94|nr:hypothetical protein [uncultured Peptoniphilus sp.]